MRNLVFALGLGLGLALAVPAAAQETPEGVIDAQIRAFLADDVATAFGFAAPGIRQVFRTPENFGRMVEQGYPMVWRPAEVQYLEQIPDGGRLFQKVLILDAQGRRHLLIYEMIPTGETWRIGGVQLLPAPGLGV